MLSQRSDTPHAAVVISSEKKENGRLINEQRRPDHNRNVRLTRTVRVGINKHFKNRMLGFKMEKEAVNSVDGEQQGVHRRRAT